MKINYECLPCVINQVVKVADMTNADNRELLFQKVFKRLADMNFTEGTPELTGITFQILTEHIGNADPYVEIRTYYNKLFLGMEDMFWNKIEGARNSFEQAVIYAIIGNIIDFNPIHNSDMDDIMRHFEDAGKIPLTINHVSKLYADIMKSKKFLYLGDNCGEICLDKLLIKEIKKHNPDIEVYFAVRGKPVVNDSIEADAYYVGMDKYAKIISNGDSSLGTVLRRTSDEFKQVYQEADIIIAKGQANYECLSEEYQKNIYFFLVTKCDVIAKDIGVAQKSFICMKKITFKQLNLEEAVRIREIDASQFIGRAWREVDGVRQLIEINYQDPDFPNGYDNHLAALKDTIVNGGSALGAFEDGKLVGFCTVNSNVWGEKNRYALLDQIFISLAYRSKGIGKQLFIRSIPEAKRFGADKFYICAGSSEETIAFYKAMGCVEASEINDELYAGDTRDMQLEYSLNSGGVFYDGI